MTAQTVSTTCAEETATNGGESDGTEKPTRLREKRSVVVDELAGRVQASALTCS